MSVKMVDGETSSSSSALLPLVARQGAAGSVREAIPTGGVGEILDLAEQLTRIGSAGTELARRIESVTGLRGGEIQVLNAVHAGAVHPRQIASEVGQVVEAVDATVNVLVEAELLGYHAHPSDPSAHPSQLHVTPAGEAILEQVEAVQIRIADALATTLGQERTHALKTTLSAVVDVFEGPTVIDARQAS